MNERASEPPRCAGASTGPRPAGGGPTSASLRTLGDIEAAVWRELQACPRNPLHAWRTPVLATTDDRGDADARVMVLREVAADERCLRFFTDARSPKRSQIEHRPRGVVLMWSPALCWQLRLAVTITLHVTGEAVSSRWSGLRHARASADYCSPLAPGSRLHGGAEEGLLHRRASREPLGHFALLDATVETIDWLELHVDGHRRARFTSQGAQWIQP